MIVDGGKLNGNLKGQYLNVFKVKNLELFNIKLRLIRQYESVKKIEDLNLLINTVTVSLITLLMHCIRLKDKSANICNN